MPSSRRLLTLLAFGLVFGGVTSLLSCNTASLERWHNDFDGDRQPFWLVALRPDCRLQVADEGRALTMTRSINRRCENATLTGTANNESVSFQTLVHEGNSSTLLVRTLYYEQLSILTPHNPLAMTELWSFELSTPDEARPFACLHIDGPNAVVLCLLQHKQQVLYGFAFSDSFSGTFSALGNLTAVRADAMSALRVDAELQAAFLLDEDDSALSVVLYDGSGFVVVLRTGLTSENFDLVLDQMVMVPNRFERLSPLLMLNRQNGYRQAAVATLCSSESCSHYLLPNLLHSARECFDKRAANVDMPIALIFQVLSLKSSEYLPAGGSAFMSDLGAIVIVPFSVAALFVSIVFACFCCAILLTVCARESASQRERPCAGPPSVATTPSRVVMPEASGARTYIVVQQKEDNSTAHIQENLFVPKNHSFYKQPETSTQNSTSVME